VSAMREQSPLGVKPEAIKRYGEEMIAGQALELKRERLHPSHCAHLPPDPRGKDGSLYLIERPGHGPMGWNAGAGHQDIV
jgi:hypothetical protein